MKKHILLPALIAIILTSPVCSRAEIQAVFNADCQAAIHSSLAKATNSITMACYKLSDPDLVNLLIKQREKGLTVSIKMDARAVSKKRKKAFKKLQNGGIHIKTIVLPEPQHMHNKFAVIDEQTVLTGSCNWTRKAFTENKENLLIISDPELAMQYLNYWSTLQSEPVKP